MSKVRKMQIEVRCEKESCDHDSHSVEADKGIVLFYQDDDVSGAMTGCDIIDSVELFIKHIEVIMQVHGISLRELMHIRRIAMEEGSISADDIIKTLVTNEADKIEI